jgi:hypothetical protein
MVCINSRLLFKTFHYNISYKIGRGSFDLNAIFNGFLQQISTPLLEMGQHLLNQGFAAALGGLGSLGGSRGFDDIFACE